MRWAAGTLVGLALAAQPAAAQQPLALESALRFYGDNTEFHNPFREGETIFGAAARVALDVGLSDRASIAAGVCVNQRFGSEDSFEQVRPVLALTVRGRRSSFVLGTLPVAPLDAPGPDLGGPHGLLPALQRETLSFDRPCEAGLAWTVDTKRVAHRFWLIWQRLNTAAHRERFDGGTRSHIRLGDHVTIPLELHVVHEGGQLHASGPVADSAAAASGVAFSDQIGRDFIASLEVLAVGSRHVPDRSLGELSRNGIGIFGRAAAVRNAWRGHVIFWRGRNFVKDEADGNYLSVLRNGAWYHGTRDYAEAGLTRRFALAPSAVLDVAGRLHRVEAHYEYSFRIVSVISAAWKLK